MLQIPSTTLSLAFMVGFALIMQLLLAWKVIGRLGNWRAWCAVVLVASIPLVRALDVASDFESSALTTGAPAGWNANGSTSHMGVVSVSPPSTGSRSFHLTANAAYRGITSQRIAIDPQRPLTVAGMMKTGGTYSGGVGGMFGLYWYDDSGNPVPRAVGEVSNGIYIQYSTSAAWTASSATIYPVHVTVPPGTSTIPAGATFCEIRVLALQTYPLEVWFDDLMVTQGAGNLCQSVELTPTSNIQIIASGNFGTADDVVVGGVTQNVVTEDLKRYLLLALDKTALTGSGATVKIYVESEFADWINITGLTIGTLNLVDSYEIKAELSPEPAIRIKGKTALGASYGVMKFCEQYLNMYWGMPGDLATPTTPYNSDIGLSLARKTSFNIPLETLQKSPMALSRLATGLYYQDDPFLNRGSGVSGIFGSATAHFNGNDFVKALGMHNLASPSHNMINIFPNSLRTDSVKQVIFPQVPDPENPSNLILYTPPAGTQNWHPNYTHPKTLELALDAARAAFAAGEFCFSLGINDGHCVESQDSSTLSVGFVQSYYDFVDDVAAAMETEYPGRLIGLIAYGSVENPPPSLTLRDNVVVLNGNGDITNWLDKGGLLGSYEYLFGGGFWVPNIPLAAMASNDSFYNANNIRFFRAEWYPLWAFDAGKIRVRAAQFWDANVDVDEELDWYCYRMFGGAGESVASVYQLFAAKRDQDLVSTSLNRLGIQNWLKQFAQFSECTQADYDDVFELLDDAESIAQSEYDATSSGTRSRAEAQKVLDRLDMLMAFFSYSYTNFRMFDAIDRSFNRDSTTGLYDLFSLVDEMPGDLQADLGEMYNHPEWFNGAYDHINLSGGVYSSSWDDDYSAYTMLSRQANSVRLTTAFHLNQANSGVAPNTSLIPAGFHKFLNAFTSDTFTLYNYPTSPWHSPDAFINLSYSLAPDGKSALFSGGSSMGSIIESGAGEGQFYKHFLLVQALNAPADHTHQYLIEIEFEGKNGEFYAYENSLNEYAVSAKVGSTLTTIRKRILIDPEYSYNINIASVIEWRPTASNSILQNGKISVKKLTFESTPY